MTVATTAIKTSLLPGDGSDTAFPFSFKCFSAAELRVVHFDEDGVETDKLNFTVALNADQNSNPGGVVTYPSAGDPLPALEHIQILSNTPHSQTFSPLSAGGWNPATLTNALDKLALQIKQLAEKVARAIKLPLGDDANPDDLPPIAARANTYLAFDGNGDLVLDDGSIIDAAVASATADAEAAAAAAATSETNAAASAAAAAAAAAAAIVGALKVVNTFTAKLGAHVTLDAFENVLAAACTDLEAGDYLLAFVAMQFEAQAGAEGSVSATLYKNGGTATIVVFSDRTSANWYYHTLENETIDQSVMALFRVSAPGASGTLTFQLAMGEATSGTVVARANQTQMCVLHLRPAP